MARGNHNHPSGVFYLSLISRLHAHAVQAGKVAEPSERFQRSHRRGEHVVEPREPPGSREVQPDAKKSHDDHLRLEPQGEAYGRVRIRARLKVRKRAGVREEEGSRERYTW